MNSKKTALFLGFFSLFSLSLAATRIKNKPHRSLTNVKKLAELYFWAKIGGEEGSPKPKKTTIPQVTERAKNKKKKIEKKAMVRSNQIVLRNRKRPSPARKSDRLAALQALLQCPVCDRQEWSSSEQLNIHANTHFDGEESA